MNFPSSASSQSSLSISTSISAAPSPSPASSIEDYDVGRLLGRGAFSEVRLARNRLTGDAIALKISNKKKMKELEEIEKKKQLETNPNNIKQINYLLNIYKEINIHKNLSLLSSSSLYIIKFYDYFEDSYNLYQCLEYLPYNNFYFFYNNYFKSKKFNNFTIILLIYQIIKFLKFLYQNNIIYRDLKLSNILLSNYPIKFYFNNKYKNNNNNYLNKGEINYYKNFLEFENFISYNNNDNIISKSLNEDDNDNDSFYYIPIKFCDFNLSTKINHPDDELHTICGTLNYLSPEILKNSSYTFSSDIWSLGCLLYKLIYNEFPFQFNDYNIIHHQEAIENEFFSPLSLSHAPPPPPPPSPSRFPSNSCKINLPYKIHPEIEKLLLSLLELNSSNRPHINTLLTSFNVFNMVPSDDFFRVNYIENENLAITDQFFPEKLIDINSNMPPSPIEKTESHIMNGSKSNLESSFISSSNYGNFSQDSLLKDTSSTPTTISKEASILSSNLSNNSINNYSVKPIARNLLKEFNSNIVPKPGGGKNQYYQGRISKNSAEDVSFHSFSSILSSNISFNQTLHSSSINTSITTPKSVDYNHSDIVTDFTSLRKKFGFNCPYKEDKLLDSKELIILINEIRKLKEKLKFSSSFYFETSNHNWNEETSLFSFFINFFSNFNENSSEKEFLEYEKYYKKNKMEFQKFLNYEKNKNNNLRIIFENNFLFIFSSIYTIMIDFNQSNFKLYYSFEKNKEEESLIENFFTLLKKSKLTSIANDHIIISNILSLVSINRKDELIECLTENKSYKIISNSQYEFLIQGNFNFSKLFSVFKYSNLKLINIFEINSKKINSFILIFYYLKSFLSLFILKNLTSYIIYFNNQSQNIFNLEQMTKNRYSFFSSLIMNSSFNYYHFIHNSSSLQNSLNSKNQSDLNYFFNDSIYSLVKVNFSSNFSFNYFLPDFIIEFKDSSIVSFLFTSNELNFSFNPTDQSIDELKTQNLLFSIPLIQLDKEDLNINNNIISMLNLFHLKKSNNVNIEILKNKFLSMILMSFYLFEKISNFFKELEEQKFFKNNKNFPFVFNKEI